MKRVVKWLGIGVGALVALVGLGLGVIFVLSQARLSRSYDVEAHPVAVVRDSGSVARGRHLYETRGCADCHAEDLGGAVFIDEAPLARLAGSNLTSGAGGVAYEYGTVGDWERAVRHGVGPDGRALLFMPSVEYHSMGRDDLGALIAYLESAAPVDRVLPGQSVRPLGRFLFLTGQVPLVHAELVDHAAPHPDAPPVGPTAEYGRYLAAGCTGCHGEELGGGPVPGAPPSWPPASNLTPHPVDGLGAWDESDFVAALRRGRRPDGTQLDPVMPWSNTARMTDDEIQALWAYLRTLPPTPDGS